MRCSVLFHTAVARAALGTLVLLVVAAGSGRAADAPDSLVAPLASTGPLVIGAISLESPTVGRYQKLEATFTLGGTWTNPFDPDQVKVDAVFRTPSGRSITLPGFFYQGYTRSLENGQEHLERAGEPVWKVRFAPVEEGHYTWTVTAANRSTAGTAVVRREGPAFSVTPSSSPGFVRRAKEPGYFRTDDGSLWFGVGENVCWSGRGGTYDYDHWYRKLADNGANYSRLWTEPFDSFTLEQYDPSRPDAGIGKYKQDDAWRLDYVTTLAEKYGIRQMFTLDSYNILRHVDAYPDWAQNPYAREHGGPIDQPSQYFTDPTARQYYQKRLRYIIARWGYSTSVMCWEFWNEVNGIEQFDPAKVAAWHAEMGDYLKQHDPYQHLRTTSVWVPEGVAALDRLPELDFVQTHAYAQNDFATFIPRIEDQKKGYGKPHWFGEFGVGYATENGTNLPPRESDPTGISVHNGAWASLMSGCAGTAMVWYWDDYVDPMNLYPIYQPIARFAAGLPLQNERSEPLRVASWNYQDPHSTSGPAAVEMHGGSVSWGPSPQNQPRTFTLSDEGVLSDPGSLTGILHGLVNHKDLHNPMTFRVDYPAAGTFGVQVHGVSGFGGAALEIDLDGTPLIKQAFTDTNPPGQHATLTQYNKLYSVDVPAGKHTIRVTNDGADWVMVDFSATSAFVRHAPNLMVTGLQFRNSALLWLRSPLYTWRDQLEKTPLPVQPAGVLVLNGFRRGRYRITWMDTHSGEWQPAQTISAQHGKLTIITPAVAADIAARIDREG